jgi:hypothetical protein
MIRKNIANWINASRQDNAIKVYEGLHGGNLVILYSEYFPFIISKQVSHK